MPRIIGAEAGVNFLRTFVDAAHAVHMDMKSHTGGLVTMGTGVIHARSSKQKLNTKSSTESEFVSASDYITWPLWLKRVLQHQGYKLDFNIFYQDNESAIKLEKNGAQSCGEKSRHIKIRYFLLRT